MNEPRETGKPKSPSHSILKARAGILWDVVVSSACFWMGLGPATFPLWGRWREFYRIGEFLKRLAGRS